MLYRIAYWSLAPVVCIVLYWYGLKSWFQMDDFAWLNLHSLVKDWPTFIDTLFRPMAQGTVRPISERLFFLSFWQLFGMEALPYRILVFLTQFANLTLITLITWRLTRSDIAGLLASLLWLASPVLYEPLSWTSAYNQILCSLFLLLQLYLFIRFLDTKRKSSYIGMWIIFLLGFGVLELNVVAPAILLVYALLYARRYYGYVVPMFLVSAAFTVWHRYAGRGIQSDVYAMDFHPGILLYDLWSYINLSVFATGMARVSTVSTQTLLVAGYIVLITIGACIIWRLKNKDRLPLLLLTWYFITLAPYLPLKNHISDYYLTIPMIGLSILMAWGAVVAWESGSAGRAVTVVGLFLYAVPCSWQANYYARDFYLKSRRVRDVVRAAAYAHKIHPDKTVVLKGVDSELFWACLFDRPQLALGWDRLYITGDAENGIVTSPDRVISDRFMPEAVLLQAIQQGKAVVYDVAQRPVRNVTRMYRSVLELRDDLPLPHVILPSNPLYANYIRDGWFEPEQDSNFRWSSKRSTVEIRGPSATPATLTIVGVVSPKHTENGPMSVRVSVDARALGEQIIPQHKTDFVLNYKIPDDLVRKPSMLVAIESDRTVSSESDSRDLALLIGSIQALP